MSIIGTNVEAVIRTCLAITLYVVSPCLAFLAYRGWAKHGRTDLPNWRNFLGLGSLMATLIVWLGTAYLKFRLFAHLPEDIGAWTIPAVLVTILAAMGSLTLQGRPRVCAFAAAVLTGLPWIFDFTRMLIQRA